MTREGKSHIYSLGVDEEFTSLSVLAILAMMISIYFVVFLRHLISRLMWKLTYSLFYSAVTASFYKHKSESISAPTTTICKNNGQYSLVSPITMLY